MNHDPLTQFFYILMRDKLPTGEVEAVMEHVRKAAGMDVTHSAPHLELYASSLAAEVRSIECLAKSIRDNQPEPPAPPLPPPMRQIVEGVRIVDSPSPQTVKL